MRWSHVGLNCRDTKLTSEFYIRWFGYAPARTVPLGDDDIVFLRKDDDTYLELFPSPAAPGGTAAVGTAPDGTAPDGTAGSETPGVIRHVAFQTENVDEFLRAMGDAVDITLGPLDFSAFIAGWKTVWLRDPDGVVVEVSQGYRDQEE
ncbi:MAG: VOC family protein [Trebonia sp.]